MKISIVATLDSVVEGKVMSPSPGRTLTPISIKVLINTLDFDFIEVKGYRDESGGKITYSQPILDAKLDKCLAKHKVGDKISIDIISFDKKLIQYIGR